MRKFDVDFPVWYLKKYIREQRKDYVKFTDNQIWGKWIRLHDSMKFGVLIDFFDSVGISIEIVHNWRYGHFWGYVSQEINSINGHRTESFSTRPEARKAAIEKAIEIYESK